MSTFKGAEMHEKDPYLIELLRAISPYVATFILASWGGAVRYFQSVRTGKEAFKLKAFAMEVSIAAFAGLTTHFFCQWAGVEGAGSSMLISVSGYLGVLALESLSGVYKRIVGAFK